MHVQTKFLRLCEPVSLGDRIDDWRVSWLGGWDKCRVFFVVMVEREHEQTDSFEAFLARPSPDPHFRCRGTRGRADGAPEVE